MRVFPALLLAAVLSGCTTTQSLDYTRADAAQLATLSTTLRDKPVEVIPLRGTQLRVIFLRIDADSAYFRDRSGVRARPQRTYHVRTGAIHAIAHREGPVRPAVTGGVVGFFGGLLGGLAFANIVCGKERLYCERSLEIGTGLLGGLIGAFIGAANPKTTHYVLNQHR